MDETTTDSFSDKLMNITRTAWRYFVYNCRSTARMVNSVSQCQYSTIWDMGSALGAFICPERVGIIPAEDFKE
nr:DUF3131 domain-containing protein [Desulfobacterales bacterium]